MQNKILSNRHDELVSASFVQDTTNNQVGRFWIKSGRTPSIIGFTLIELLVVVLIIGILAAVALPQYEIAVAKSRAAQMLPLIRAFANAEDVFFMENGSYTYNYDDLHVGVPSTKTTTCRSKPAQTCYDVNGWTFELFRANPGGAPISVEAYDGKNVVLISYFEPSRRATYGRLTCIAKQEFGKKICKALGGTLTSTANYYIIDK